MKTLVVSVKNIFRFYETGKRLKVFITWLKLLLVNRFVGSSTSGDSRLVGFEVFYGNRGSLYGMFKEIFLEQNYLIEPTKEPVKILDCGSNIGMSVLYFKFLAPNSVITSFEPNPHTFNILKKNIEENGLSVTLHNSGLAKNVEEVTMFTDSEDMSSQSASKTKHLNNKKRPLESVVVKMERLSPYITEPVDVLKLDIEGAEGEVLEELAEAGKLSLIKKIFIEYHFDGENTTYPLGRMLTLLDEAGFKYVIDTGISFPYSVNRSRKNYSSKVIAWRE